MRVTLKLRRSFRLAALLAIAHAGAWAAVAAATPSMPLRLALAAGVAASFWLAVRRAALLTAPDAIVAIEWNEGDIVAIQTRDGKWHEARVLPTTFVSPALTVIGLRTRERPRTRHVVLLADSAAADDYRRLRARLLWSRAPTA